MRIGIFGGTFDPVHVGHLIVAEQCREQADLQEIWFVPSARPPHKLDRAQTPFAHRAEMIRLAIAGHASFRVDELERDRPGPSFTVDTLEELTASHPEHEFHLILGSDCLPDLPSWREPQRIAELASFAIVERPGSPCWPRERFLEELKPVKEVRVHLVHSPLLEIASRDLRQRVAQARSIRYQVPRAVECYIETHGLYRE